jgi:lipopolysaccharide transport system permease protein
VVGTENRPECVIRPRRGLIAIDFAELWRYRELFWFLAWRDILVRYKQTVLGMLWAALQPLLTMLVFTVLFGRLAKFPSNGAPYAVITLAALLPWQLFANAMTQGSASLIASSSMITKVYFPRLIIPSSATLSGLVDFAISFVILIGVMLWYGVTPRWGLLLLPLFSLSAFLAAFGAALWLSALNVRYRDVKHVVPFLVRIGTYVSPVGFLSEVVPERWRLWYSLNPIVGVIDGFRWAILGPDFTPYWPGFWLGLAVCALVLVSGALFFRSTEKTFADVI